ncbi:MAG TPA: DUF4402 domain-containing protein [Flavitalea sp.]|nr:DUF4402 domain-containing protein [Flavitalea sp.]
MKTFTKMIASALMLTVFATSVRAQSANATANASAQIVSAISIGSTRNLHFGSISPGASGGTVQVAATLLSARTLFGANLTATAGAVTSAIFTVTGDGAATYAITRVPVAATSLVLTSGLNTMNALLVVSTAAGAGVETPTGTISGATGTDGTQIIYVGGTLTVGASQAAGLYTNPGGISLTVNYN